MSLTGQLVELIENKSIDDEDLEAASWFLLDAIANIAAGRNTEQGRILSRWFLEEPPDTSRKVLWLRSLMHILEVDHLHRRSVVHPGCVVIPAVLALARYPSRQCGHTAARSCSADDRASATSAAVASAYHVATRCMAAARQCFRAAPQAGSTTGCANA